MLRGQALHVASSLGVAKTSDLTTDDEVSQRIFLAGQFLVFLVVRDIRGTAFKPTNLFVQKVLPVKWLLLRFLRCWMTSAENIVLLT